MKDLVYFSTPPQESIGEYSGLNHSKILGMYVKLQHTLSIFSFSNLNIRSS